MMVMMVIMVVLTQNDDPSWSVPSCLGQLPCGPPCHHLSSVFNVQGRNGLELQLTKTTQYLSEVRFFRQTIPLLIQQTENSSLYPIGVREQIYLVSVGQEVKKQICIFLWGGEDLGVSLIEMLSIARN